MTREEVGHILTKAAMIDNRAVTPALIQAWHELIGDIDYADAMAALNYHRANSTEYLVPAHIIAGVRRIRADRIERAITAAPPAAIADDAAAARRWMDQQIAAIADGRHISNALGLPAGQRRQGPPPEEFQRARGALTPDDDTTAPVRQAALQVPCPHCRARASKPCTLSGTRSPLLGRPAHDARIEAAAQS